MDRQQDQWFKSSYSGGSGTECVEVADLRGTVGVRDSKWPSGGHIAVHPTAWDDFIQELSYPTFPRRV